MAAERQKKIVADKLVIFFIHAAKILTGLLRYALKDGLDRGTVREN
jgi:hypothetical protein